MSYWHQLLDSLDSPGGHILILVSLLGLGAWMGDMELRVAAMGALFAVLRTTESNQARQNGLPPKG